MWKMIFQWICNNDCRVAFRLGFSVGWGYTHDLRADKYPYPHDRRAVKDSYSHYRNVTGDFVA